MGAVTSWQLRARSSCEWDLLADGQLGGMVTFVPDTELSHGRHAHIVLAALNATPEQLVQLAPPDATYLAAGWSGAGEYQRLVEGIREFVNTFPPEARGEIETAWRRAEMPHPMNRTQMTEWQDTVLSVLTAYRAQEHAA